MKEIYLHVDAVLREKVSEIRYFDFDLGQFEAGPPHVSWPCCLFNFNDATFTDLLAGIQETTQQFVLRIGFKIHERTSSINTEEYRLKALEHLDIVKKIADALNGSASENTFGYTRTAQSQEIRGDYRIYSLTFECIGYECPEVMDFMPPDEPPGFCYNVSIQEPGINIILNPGGGGSGSGSGGGLSSGPKGGGGK